MAELTSGPPSSPARSRAAADLRRPWTVGVSSDGPVEHAKTWCANGHWCTPTLDTLTTQPTPSLAPEPAVRVMAG